MPAKPPLACLFFILLLFTACSGLAVVNESSSKTRLVYLLANEPGKMDPHTTDELEIAIPLRQIYDTLVYRDPISNTLVSGLANDWNISEDGLVYTFTLRQGVHFHDGVPFNSQAVAANLDRINDPSTGAAKSRRLLASYVGHEIIDDYTIRIQLREPYTPFLDALSQVYLGIASPTALKQYSSNRYQFHQVGTGPFIFLEYIPGQRIVIRRNTQYNWGPTFYQRREEDYIDEIEFRFVPDAQQRFEAIQNGSAQIVSDLLPEDARTLTGNSEIQIVPASISGQPLQFLMNTSRFPTDNLAVRQALIYGINRNVILDTVYQRFSSIAWGPLNISGIYDNQRMVGLYGTDITKARALLADAGYQDNNADGFLDIGGADFIITLITPAWDFTPEVAKLLEEQWRTIGIKVKSVPVATREALKAQVANNDYNLVGFSEFGTDPALLNSFFSTDGEYNWSRVANTQLDDLLADGLKQNEEGRRQIYAGIEQYIMEQALVLPVVDFIRLDGVSRSTDNLLFDHSGIPILVNVKEA
jgi:peptide/nickel transport system substrate-binding protein